MRMPNEQTRIHLFESVVGKLQPILARLSGAIGNAVLRGTEQSLPDSVLGELDEAESQGFDLDAMLEDDVTMPERPEPPRTMAYLEDVIENGLVPPHTQMRRIQKSEFGLANASLPEEIRITTDPDYYAEHSDSVEFWSPGGVVFPDG